MRTAERSIQHIIRLTAPLQAGIPKQTEQAQLLNRVLPTHRMQMLLYMQSTPIPNLKIIRFRQERVIPLTVGTLRQAAEQDGIQQPQSAQALHYMHNGKRKNIQLPIMMQKQPTFLQSKKKHMVLN